MKGPLYQEIPENLVPLVVAPSHECHTRLFPRRAGVVSKALGFHCLQDGSSCCGRGPWTPARVLSHSMLGAVLECKGDCSLVSSD